MSIQDWKILKHGRKQDFIIITVITIIFLLVIVMNDRLIFQITSDQAEEIGETQLEVIRSEFQNTISTAENTTSHMALEAEQMLRAGTSKEEIRKIFYKKAEEQRKLSSGVCFNVYITGKDWTIIPNFDAPPEYHATERLWYKGAAANPGKIYTTEPYVDAMTGMMCFTMSKMLPDNETVVALDFNFKDVQKSILQMSATNDRKALIVTKTGTIIGYTDMNLVGEKIEYKLPECEQILNHLIQTEENIFTVELKDGEHTIFTNETKNGWYMILSVDNWEFYKESYIQILFTSILSLLMMLSIIFFYLNAMKNKLRAETALHVKEEFLSRLSGELRDPLKTILDMTDVEALHIPGEHGERAGQVREAALKLSGMLDNLFSFSTIVIKDKTKLKEEKIFQDKELSKVSRYARIGVVTVLVSAMLLAFAICFETTMSWGDTKMNREVDLYENQLNNWIDKQRSILSMFVNLFANHPELTDDYESTVKFLDELTKKYPEISVCYIANPYKKNPVIMNNGWQPGENFRPETRPWYIDTEKSESGFSVSTPYYDAQTGLYCVTLAQMVYGPKGEFIGIFGIDFYLDTLINVLGESYNREGYAFLVDRNGIIVNHPNNNYQLSKYRMTDVSGTEYSSAYMGTHVATIRDYTNTLVACYAKKNKTSNFTVVVANNWWNIYGSIVLLGVLFLLLLGISVMIVKTLINRMVRWQESVNGQLKDASDTAMAASQAKSQFLAQMSHEIRTPINAVLGMNEMILRESKSQDILEYSTNIQSAGRTLLTLINSILDFSKIEDGKMEIVPVRYEIIPLIDDLVNMISEKARKKGLEFRTAISPNLPQSLYGDDVRVRQIVTNILTNAVKYTHEGFVELNISGDEIDSNTYELKVIVSDSGIGIREKDMDKLFQSFQRIDEERNRNIEGTGLGIAIVQKLLAMMGSKLQVRSVYGEGSEFSFVLTQKIIDRNPIGDYDKHSLKHIKHGEQKKFLTAPEAKILAIDDNDMNLKVISGLLKRNKIVPDLAESGQEGIELARENFYHIIFMDNMMPVMNGIETLKEMQRQNILTEDTTIIMLTASAIAGMRETYLREGFNDYLSKPIDVNQLEKMLEKYLPDEIISFETESKKKLTPKTKSEPKSDTETTVETTTEENKPATETISAVTVNTTAQIETATEEKSTAQSETVKEEKISAAEEKTVAKTETEIATEEKPTEQATVTENEEFYGEDDEELDEFTDSEKEIFNKTCPDINLELALQYCMDSKSFLVQMLMTYLDPKRVEKIQDAYDSSDIKNYQILVHALKSTSLSIGAEDLSARAKKLELAAKENDIEQIKADHGNLMAVYQRVREQLSKWLEGNS
ncbi:MAG: response regulator [Selenomonadaceae bacterium]|nr:response regulator [Selenomonadaceae bacterium]